MKFEKLMQMIEGCGWFDLATLVQLAGEPRSKLLTQLHRWCESGKLIPLRRGMYALAREYRRTEIQPAALANQLYAPSYLSLEWALSYYGLIPEKTVAFTSISTRQTKRFSNDFGVFLYRHFKPDGFFGYRRLKMTGNEVVVATPEKALLDFWRLTSGEWSENRMLEMRLQNFDIIDMEKLNDYAARLNSPKIYRALKNFTSTAKAEKEGTIDL